MATLLAHIRVRAGKETEWENVIREMVQKTLDNEDGVIRYEYWRRQTPREYCCLLAFENKHAFLVHPAADYHVDQPWAGLIENIDLEWVDPVAGAAPLGATIDAPLDQDAPADLIEWEKRSPVQEAQWWGERR